MHVRHGQLGASTVQRQRGLRNGVQRKVSSTLTVLVDLEGQVEMADLQLVQRGGQRRYAAPIKLRVPRRRPQLQWRATRLISMSALNCLSCIRSDDCSLGRWAWPDSCTTHGDHVPAPQNHPQWWSLQHALRSASWGWFQALGCFDLRVIRMMTVHCDTCTPSARRALASC